MSIPTVPCPTGRHASHEHDSGAYAECLATSQRGQRQGATRGSALLGASSVPPPAAGEVEAPSLTWGHEGVNEITDVGGAFFGDNATGYECQIVWISPENPNARATSMYAVTENEQGRFQVDQMTELITFTDPEDVGGSETGSRYDYGNGSLRDYETKAEAERECKRLADGEAALGTSGVSGWDGVI